MKKQQEEICKRIIAKWGVEVQVNKIQEEALELALVLNQRNCPTKDPKAMEDALYDELADMKIMMMQADLLFDADRIAERVRYKFDRVVSKHLGESKAKRKTMCKQWPNCTCIGRGEIVNGFCGGLPT